MKINQKEQEIILKTLLKIPPDSLRNYCYTELTNNHWFDCKLFFEMLNESLNCYFSGEQWQPKNTHKRLYELVELWRNYYVQFYDLVYNCWQPLQAKLHRLNLDFKSPGQFISELLTVHSYEMFLRIIPELTTGNYYKDFSPRKYNKLVRKYQKLSRKKELSRIEESQLKDLQKTRKFELKEVAIMNALIQLVVDTASKQPKRLGLTQDSLKSFELANQKLAKFRLKATHPREKLQGWAIAKGELKEGCSEGGTYKSS